MQKEIKGCCYKTKTGKCIWGYANEDIELGLCPPSCEETRKNNSCGMR